jgi:hypothetical protein
MCALLMNEILEMKAFYNLECLGFAPSYKKLTSWKKYHLILLVILGLSHIQCSIKADLKAFI